MYTYSFKMQLSTYARKDCSSSSKNLHAYMYYAVVVTPTLNKGARPSRTVTSGNLATPRRYCGGYLGDQRWQLSSQCKPRVRPWSDPTRSLESQCKPRTTPWSRPYAITVNNRLITNANPATRGEAEVSLSIKHRGWIDYFMINTDMDSNSPYCTTRYTRLS